ncbi:DUF5655 domain-containing protein [Virgisporangium ochraceum]|uniref:DUF5655 domain-containing protein n=1 Tax=Virgisporangium ochraceum TaxID=65505 RepID=A0A8J3ZUJ4_9ACTN|nr:hypothetical protein [Virgisporangium ochraceum]GIJ67760.1 hypothetical protein Voc01_026770 [Virgisporangium ochraceum]
MARWTCPACDREFDRTRQSHVCVPGCTIDDTFRGREWQRPICDEIVGFVAGLGPVHVDAVGVGVFLKRQRKLAEIRPKVRALSIWVWRPGLSGDRAWQKRNLTDRTDVDDQLRDWLTESYDAAG